MKEKQANEWSYSTPGEEIESLCNRCYLAIVKLWTPFNRFFL